MLSIINININTESAYANKVPALFKGMTYVVRANCYKQDGTAFVFETGDEFSFVIGNSYSTTATPIIVSNNSVFNLLTDWSSVSLANGKICWEINTDNSTLDTELGSSSQKTMMMELCMIHLGQYSVLMHSQVIMKNVAVEY